MLPIVGSCIRSHFHRESGKQGLLSTSVHSRRQAVPPSATDLRPTTVAGLNIHCHILSLASSWYQKRVRKIPPSPRLINCPHSQDAGCLPLLLHLCLFLHGLYDGRPLAVEGVDDGDLQGQGEVGRQVGRHHRCQLWHRSRGEQSKSVPATCLQTGWMCWRFWALHWPMVTLPLLAPIERKLKGEELASYQFICTRWSKVQSISRV